MSEWHIRLHATVHKTGLRDSNWSCT